MSVHERLKYVLRELKLNQKTLATMAGIPYRTVQNYLLGKREPTANNLAKIAKALEIDIWWLMMGEGNPFERKQHKVEEEYVYVPYVAGRISAGRGLIPDVNAELRLAFRREWITRFGDPKNMSLIKVEGDSMEPTLVSGDVLLVDHGKNYISPQGGIYVVTVGEEVMVKRLHIDYSTQKVKVISDNQRYPSFDLSPDQITINGKVIWYGRTLER